MHKFVLATLVLGSIVWSPPLAAEAPAPAEVAAAKDAFIPISPKPRSPSPRETVAARDYQTVIEQTMTMVSNPAARRLGQKFGLDILNVTWEDTGRYKNSAVGPNISDMTIQVQHRNPRTQNYELNLMPVIRYPNFADKSADIPLERFFLRVGNHNGNPLQRVSLKRFLKNMRRYLSEPESWPGANKSLLAKRDTHVLVSAQACFLPIPKGGTAEFNPVLFNYQSYAGDPAVLTILATREGASVTVIDNQRDAFEAGQTWGQRLFFNQNGERTSLTGQRASDAPLVEGQNSASNPSAAAEDKGLNMVLLIQVPLKQKQPLGFDFEDGIALPTLEAAPQAKSSDVEAAVVGHGEVEGPFTEIDNLKIERDPKLPIRVTVQFYKATTNGVVSAGDMNTIHQQIARVYNDADYVGSLVVGGDTGRPTEYEGSKQEPQNWWQQFWQRHQQNTGQPQDEAMQMLRYLLSGRWLDQE